MKIQKTNRLVKLAICASLAAAATASMVNLAFSAPMSDSLPAPNYVKGATLKYGTGFQINNNAGSLATSKQIKAANAADNSTKLNIDLGSTQNNIADLRYNSFNIDTGNNVNFKFGASGQAAINKVTVVNSNNYSNILGSITQSGKGGAVFLINPNGILFGSESLVKVDSFTASTLGLVGSIPSNCSKCKTIKFARGNNDPAGIVVEEGAEIDTTFNAALIANGINDEGDISASKGNVQLITGDGVTFKFCCNYKADPVKPSDIAAATGDPDDVSFPEGETIDNHAIEVGEDATIKGQNVNIMSKINNKGSFDELVNIDGLVVATGSSEKCDKCSDNDKSHLSTGIITLYAENTNVKGSAGIELGGGRLTCDGVASINPDDVDSHSYTHREGLGIVDIISDKVVIDEDGFVKADIVLLEPTSKNIPIVFDTKKPGPNSYLVPDFTRIDAKAVVVGNLQTTSDITGEIPYLGVDTKAPVALVLVTKGDIDLEIEASNPDSHLITVTGPNSDIDVTTK